MFSALTVLPAHQSESQLLFENLALWFSKVLFPLSGEVWFFFCLQNESLILQQLKQMLYFRFTGFSYFFSKRQTVNINRPFPLENPLDCLEVKVKGEERAGLFGFKQNLRHASCCVYWNYLPALGYTGGGLSSVKALSSGCFKKRACIDFVPFVFTCVQGSKKQVLSMVHGRTPLEKRKTTCFLTQVTQVFLIF